MTVPSTILSIHWPLQQKVKQNVYKLVWLKQRSCSFISTKTCLWHSPIYFFKRETSPWQSLESSLLRFTSWLPIEHHQIEENAKNGFVWSDGSLLLAIGGDDNMAYMKKISMQEGSWNKIGILLKLLSIYSAEEVEWILWMEPDAIFDDPSFVLPFESYQGVDIITAGTSEMASYGSLEGTKSLGTWFCFLASFWISSFECTMWKRILSKQYCPPYQEGSSEQKITISMCKLY